MSAIRNSFLVKSYLRLLERHPTKTMCLTTAVLHAGGDVIAQKIIEKKEHLELMRTGRFFLIGLAWDGPLLSWWYRVLSRALPGASKSTTILKVALDQGVFIPGMLASFLVLNGALKGMDGHDIKEILNRDYFQLLLANYQLWPLAMTLNFYLMPLKHQVLFTNSVSLAWNTYLSWKANQQLIKTELTGEQTGEQTREQTRERVQNDEEQTTKDDKNDQRFTLLPDINSNCAFLSNNNNNCFDLNNNNNVINNNNNNNNNYDNLNNGNAVVDPSGNQRQETEQPLTSSAPIKETSFFTRGWNIDFLSHPYALLPR